MNYYTPIPGHFMHYFRKGQFTDLLRYTSLFSNADLWIDISLNSVFFTGSNYHYLKPIYEAKGIVYLFTFTRLNADQCIRAQIPYKSFMLIIENYLFTIDFNIEVDSRYIGSHCFNLHLGNDDE